MPREKTKGPYAAESGPRYVRVVEAFAGDRHVSLETRRGFGSGALKVNGKIFAMLSSKCQFIVKLPKNRVDELVNRGEGQRFDLGHGRIMTEWFVVGKAKANWFELAREAYDFMKQQRA